MIVERCFEVKDDPEMFVGEKAATVGGRESPVRDPDTAPSFCVFVLGAMEASHGISDKTVSIYIPMDVGFLVRAGKLEEYQELPYNLDPMVY